MRRSAVLVEKIQPLGAATVNVCALLNKPSRRIHDYVEVAYVGFRTFPMSSWSATDSTTTANSETCAT